MKLVDKERMSGDLRILWNWLVEVGWIVYCWNVILVGLVDRGKMILELVDKERLAHGLVDKGNQV